MNEKEVIDRFVNSPEFYIIEEYVSKPYEDTIIEQDKEIQVLKNNWDELKNMVDNEIGYYIEDEDDEWFEAKKIQNIMKEIEERSYEK